MILEFSQSQGCWLNSLIFDNDHESAALKLRFLPLY